MFHLTHQMDKFSKSKVTPDCCSEISWKSWQKWMTANFLLKCTVMLKEWMTSAQSCLYRQVCRQIKFASMADHAGNVINFTKNHASKYLFSSQHSRETCSLFFVSVIRKVKSWIEQNILLLLFICKMQVISYCKVLKVFNSNFSILFNPSISFSELELLLIHG